jgi:hypothetical protein
VELVYNYSFFGNSNKTKMTDLKIESINTERVSNDNFQSSEYKLKEVLIYGKLYQAVSNSVSDVLLALNRLPKEIPFSSEFGWYCYKLGIKMRPVNFDDSSFSIISIIKLIGYSKEDLIQYIEGNRQKIDFDELKTRINLAQKNKEI